MAPSPHDIAVATDALRAESGIWSAQAHALDTAAATAGGLPLTRLQAGVFQIIVSAHNDLANALAARCAEGGTEMRRIAATLHQVADTYDAEERHNLHALSHLY